MKYFILPLFLLLSSCFQRKLPGEVQYNFLEGGYHDLVVNSDGLNVVVVEPDVKWVRSTGHYIFGLTEKYSYSDGTSSKAGYFVLDTRNRKVVNGLSYEEMLNKVRD
jgi:hypothetical protein